MSSLIQPRSAIEAVQRHTFAASWGFTAIARPCSKTEGGRETTERRRERESKASSKNADSANRRLSLIMHTVVM